MSTSADSPVTFDVDGRVGLIVIDNPPVNAFGNEVRTGLDRALSALVEDRRCQVIVLCTEGRLFSAGADIREFDGPMAEPGLPELIERFESSEKPVVAAIDATAMGGATELALGCHYRLGAPAARLGLPEVRIGLIPGAGGTQRLPRLVGTDAALEMITRGRPVDAGRAWLMGLLDAVVDSEDFRSAAVRWADRLAEHPAPARRTRERSVALDTDRIAAARERIGDGPGSGPARACVAAIAAAEGPFEEGMAEESRLFQQCLEAPESGALRHLFFAEREAARVPDMNGDIVPRPFESVVIIGAGTMGCGIAMACADSGLNVCLRERNDEVLQRGLERVTEGYRRQAEKGRVDAATAAARAGRIRPAFERDLEQADLVIEAVYEDLDIKCQVFAELSHRCRPGAVLATNTSTLDVDRIAAATDRPGDVLGLHFFSPANVMRLLEIVRAERTAPDVLASAIALGRRLGKVGVIAGVCDGFIGNRMLEGYIREAGRVLMECGRPERIDSALTRWGWAMGPFEVSDLAGLDIGQAVRRQRGIDGREDPCYAVAETLVTEGRLGQKSGSGFYRYEVGRRGGQPDKAVARIVSDQARRFGIRQRDITDEEIVERCLLPLVNEGARILDEGIALRAADIDLVWVNGYGFPAFRGGPMYHAADKGLDHMLSALKRHAPGDDPLWKPAELLRRQAESGDGWPR